MNLEYTITVNMPDDWQAPGYNDRTPYQTGEAIAAELRRACARIVPTTDCTWDVVLAAYTDPAERGEQQLTRAGISDLVKVSERFTGRGSGRELERMQQFDIDARGGQVNIHHPPPANQYSRTGYARCADCGTRYEITGDPTENHHRAMRHKFSCGKAATDQYSPEQAEQLKTEFDAQPHIQAQTLRWFEQEKQRAQQLTAPSSPAPAAPRCQRCGHTHVFKCGCGCEDAQPKLQAIGVGKIPLKLTGPEPTAERPWWKFW